MCGTQDNELRILRWKILEIIKNFFEALKPETKNSKNFIKRKVITMKKRDIEFQCK